MTIAEQRFLQDKKKQEKLYDILHDPVFLEAVVVVCDAVSTPIYEGTIESAALRGAFVSGFRQAFRELEALPKKFEAPDKPKPLPKPWSHITKEKSTFDIDDKPKPTNP